MSDQIQTAESTAMEKFVVPTETIVGQVVNNGGPIQVRSDVQYERAALALRTVREKRKALTAYFKEQPKDEPGPGQGLCFYARRAWEAANSLFSKFDQQFIGWDTSLNSEMSRYRAEVECKAREEAEAKAEEERKRLEAEAKKVAKTDKVEAARLQEEAAAVVPIIEREVPQAEGFSVRKTWKAEVVNLAALVQEVAAGRAPLTCLEASESGCNKLAVAFGGLNAPRGLVFKQVEISTTRKTR
jgi:hypothetical protein